MSHAYKLHLGPFTLVNKNCDISKIANLGWKFLGNFSQTTIKPFQKNSTSGVVFFFKLCVKLAKLASVNSWQEKLWFFSCNMTFGAPRLGLCSCMQWHVQTLLSQAICLFRMLCTFPKKLQSFVKSQFWGKSKWWDKKKKRNFKNHSFNQCKWSYCVSWQRDCSCCSIWDKWCFVVWYKQNKTNVIVKFKEYFILSSKLSI